MPIADGTSIGVSRNLARTIREIAAREDRTIATVIERMVEAYEPLTLLDHAIVAGHARDLKTTTGQALSDIIQSWKTRCSGMDSPST